MLILIVKEKHVHNAVIDSLPGPINLDSDTRKYNGMFGMQ